VQTQESPRTSERRLARAPGLVRRSQVRRRDAASTAAVAILLVFGLSLLVIVVAQAALGFDPFGLSSTAAERPTLVVAGATPPAAVPALAAQPAEVAVPDPTARPLVAEPGLAALVQQQLGGQRATFGVAMKNLETGQGTLVNADREFPAGGLAALLIAYEAYHQRDTGRLAFGDPLRVTEQIAQRGSPEAPAGSTVSVGWAVDRLLSRGDPAMAALLLERLGPQNLNAALADLGLLESRVNGERVTTSPRDLLFLLDRLARGEGLSPASNAELLRYLVEPRPNDRLAALLPRGTLVAQRSAADNEVVAQAAIVYSPAAALVVVSLATDVANPAGVAQAQAALAKAVYDYFNQPRADATPGRASLRTPAVGPRPSPPPVQLTPLAPAPAAPLAYPTPEPPAAPRPAAPTAPVVAATPVPTAPRLAEPPPPPAITAVRPTAPPALAPTAPAQPFAPAVTAVRPTAPPAAPPAPTTAPALVPTVSVPPPTAPARGPLPPTLGPAAPGPTAPRDVPRFGQ
jgi:beta-lactamase class A